MPLRRGGVVPPPPTMPRVESDVSSTSCMPSRLGPGGGFGGFFMDSRYSCSRLLVFATCPRTRGADSGNKDHTALLTTERLVWRCNDHTAKLDEAGIGIWRPIPYQILLTKICCSRWHAVQSQVAVLA